MALYVNGLVVTGGGGNANIWEGTQAEYDALVNKDPDTVYFITDTNGDGQQFQPVIYSETEREIGVWTDGKPLYQKTVLTNTAFGNTWTPVTTISGVEIVVDFEVVVYEGGNRTYGSRDGYFCEVSAVLGEEDTVVIYNNTSFSLTVKYVTLRYTKTTDVAGSGTWTPQGVPSHHYSTDEQIIGTWVDGSTLYEKTAYISSLPNNTNTEYDIGLSNIVQRGISGYLIFASGNTAPIPYENSNVQARVVFQFNANGKIEVFTNSNRTDTSAYVTVRYTKASS